jgi:hypothetical protein
VTATRSGAAVLIGAETLLTIAAAADVDVGDLRDQHRHSLIQPQ